MVDKRDWLLNKLYAYQPCDLQEDGYKNQIIEFVTSHPDCFERSLSVGHITGSAWLLDKDGSHALLMHHKKLGIWVQLGGHCDGDSNVLNVALKEAQEESGIQGIVPVTTDIFDVDVHYIPETKKEAAHYHYDVRFLLQVFTDEQFVQNDESEELRWVSKDKAELPSNALSVTRMFDKWVSRG